VETHARVPNTWITYYIPTPTEVIKQGTGDWCWDTFGASL